MRGYHWRVRMLLNVIWLVLAGFWLALGYVLFGILYCILIITIPLGVASFRIAGYALWPFGRTAVYSERSGCGTVLFNLIWLVLTGVWMALAHLFTGLLLAVTIVGIPLAVANWKMIPITLLPLGARIVPVDQAPR